MIFELGPQHGVGIAVLGHDTDSKGAITSNNVAKPLLISGINGVVRFEQIPEDDIVAFCWSV